MYMREQAADSMLRAYYFIIFVIIAMSWTEYIKVINFDTHVWVCVQISAYKNKSRILTYKYVSRVTSSAEELPVSIWIFLDRFFYSCC